jgi:hypothetical protein
MPIFLGADWAFPFFFSFFFFVFFVFGWGAVVETDVRISSLRGGVEGI